jgi:uncharacterized damage-inducible protein DinB
MTTSSTSSTSGVPAQATGELDRERQDLLESLRRHREFLRFTVRGLTEEQARLRPTVSALSLGGLVKHVTATERQWTRFAVEGESAMVGGGSAAEYAAGFAMADDETLEGLLADYAAVAAETDALVASAPDLSADHALPPAPWFTPGARWSIRRVLLHVIAETAQHAGHADILRETLDGQRTMG